MNGTGFFYYPMLDVITHASSRIRHISESIGASKTSNETRPELARSKSHGDFKHDQYGYVSDGERSNIRAVLSLEACLKHETFLKHEAFLNRIKPDGDVRNRDLCLTSFNGGEGASIKNTEKLLLEHMIPLNAIDDVDDTGANFSLLAYAAIAQAANQLGVVCIVRAQYVSKDFCNINRLHGTNSYSFKGPHIKAKSSGGITAGFIVSGVEDDDRQKQHALYDIPKFDYYRISSLGKYGDEYATEQSEAINSSKNGGCGEVLLNIPRSQVELLYANKVITHDKETIPKDSDIVFDKINERWFLLTDSEDDGFFYVSIFPITEGVPLNDIKDTKPKDKSEAKRLFCLTNPGSEVAAISDIDVYGLYPKIKNRDDDHPIALTPTRIIPDEATHNSDVIPTEIPRNIVRDRVACITNLGEYVSNNLPDEKDDLSDIDENEEDDDVFEEDSKTIAHQRAALIEPENENKFVETSLKRKNCSSKLKNIDNVSTIFTKFRNLVNQLYWESRFSLDNKDGFTLPEFISSNRKRYGGPIMHGPERLNPMAKPMTLISPRTLPSNKSRKYLSEPLIAIVMREFFVSKEALCQCFLINIKECLFEMHELTRIKKHNVPSNPRLNDTKRKPHIDEYPCPDVWSVTARGAACHNQYSKIGSKWRLPGINEHHVSDNPILGDTKEYHHIDESMPVDGLVQSLITKYSKIGSNGHSNGVLPRIPVFV